MARPWSPDWNQRPVRNPCPAEQPPSLVELHEPTSPADVPSSTHEVARGSVEVRPADHHAGAGLHPRVVRPAFGPPLAHDAHRLHADGNSPDEGHDANEVGHAPSVSCAVPVVLGQSPLGVW